MSCFPALPYPTPTFFIRKVSVLIIKYVADCRSCPVAMLQPIEACICHGRSPRDSAVTIVVTTYSHSGLAEWAVVICWNYNADRSHGFKID